MTAYFDVSVAIALTLVTLDKPYVITPLVTYFQRKLALFTELYSLF